MTDPKNPMPSLQRIRTHESTKDETVLCRICRGEATEQEPLYHPCKCSGSIMYVHQECLMEWLSHSQKKHCELCKTSFRFTKLYHPDMPDRLPTGIFLRKAAAHTGRNFIYWMRACLVACTWLVWLPWTMRFVWWGLFWLADVGWVKVPNPYARDDITFANAANATVAAENTTAAEIRSVLLSELIKGPAILRMTSWVLRLLVSGNNKGWLSNLTPDNHLQSQALVTNATQLSERGTLLSGIHALNSMTPSPLANRVIIDVLEGQIITLALVALIILVLLIREWVVQQQPIANLVNDNEEMRQALQRHAQNAEQRAEERAPPPRPEPVATEPDNVVRGLLEEANEENHIDYEKIRIEALESLIDRARAVGPTLRHLPAGSLFGDPRIPEAEAKGVIEDVLEASIILGRAYAISVHEENLEKIREVRRSLRKMRKIIPILPTETAENVEKLTTEIKQSMHRMIPMVKTKNANKASAPVSAQHSPTHITSQESSTNSSTSSPEGRPAMPPRDESSVATEIQRTLQEGAMDTSKDEANNQDNDSGSWQDPADDASEVDLADHGDANVDAGRMSLHQTESYENVNDLVDELSQQQHQAADEEHSTSSASSSQTDNRPSDDDDDDVLARSEAELAMVVNAAANEVPLNPNGHEANDEAHGRDIQPASDDNIPRNHVNEQELPKNLVDRLTDWLWGDLDTGIEQDDETTDREEDANVAQDADGNDDLPEQDPLEPEHERPVNPGGVVAPHAGPQDAQAAVDDGPLPGLLNEADGMEDAEDLEGVMELIGMQGAMSNLFTNAMFASVFVSCTIVIAVWLPFLFGKVALIMFAHPLTLIEAPFKIVTYGTNTFYDLALLSLASAFQWLVVKPCIMLIDNWQDILPIWLTETTSLVYLESVANEAMSKSVVRLFDILRITREGIDAAYSNLTFDSHAAIRTLQQVTSQTFTTFANTLNKIIGWTESLSWKSLVDTMSLIRYARLIAKYLYSATMNISHQISVLPGWMSSGNITFTYTTAEVSNPETSVAPIWTALDRGLATTIGYMFIAVLGAVYFMRLAPLARSRQSKKIENVVLEVMQQAGGIAKVVLIISIEMLVFPLYCGLLLDLAMLPLFQDASIQDRITFSRTSPWTSLFVHWFVGTAYMFHFALFVAMCRKMFRKGVLYFIRDPDDPTFHPVRDVLERTVISQLRKIASSALIYGGLVIVCVGSVIWTLGQFTTGILPIRWIPFTGANAFPIDLVLYIFIRPLAMKYLALSEWLQAIYEWFFLRCARALHLSHFIFGEADEDEQDPVSGKWLRVPANDQVRVGKGNKAFVEVDKDGKRIDGLPEPKHANGKRPKSSDFTVVFVPAHFRMRLTAFVICLWLLTAIIGFTLTVCPLILGRSFLLTFTISTTSTNDVYAFAIGLFIVCTVALTLVKIKDALREHLNLPRSNRNPQASYFGEIGQQIQDNGRTYLPKLLRCLYTYVMLWVVVAFTFSLILHLYILSPTSTLVFSTETPHTIRIFESLVIGIQLVRIMLSLLAWNAESRGARALDAIFEAGYLDPRTSLANRYLFLPIAAMSFIALFGPVSMAWIVNKCLLSKVDGYTHVFVRVFSYPATLGIMLSIWGAHLLLRATSRWRMRIRDEVFLIGERLHNYGEKKPPSTASHSATKAIP